jgi:23S rRNA pseudouridine1911/1915/1917 synthase
MMNTLSPALPPLTILYEDNHLIAVFKEPRVLTQGDRTGDESLLEMVRKWIAISHKKRGSVFLGLLHRLDRPTAGIVLFAKTSKGASRLSDQFRKREVKKVYWAFVEGQVQPPEGNLKNFLLTHRSSRKVKLFVKEADHSQFAELHYRTLIVYPLSSLIEVVPFTGRKHQIRSQLSNLGNPILGDYKYGASTKWDKGSIALLAKKMSFLHPTTKKRITLEVPLPASWRDRFLRSIT